ncbi:MAG: ERCC4 domain-containing protein [Desulfomonilia bacterium]|jgi:Fanconi anemia group M protein
MRIDIDYREKDSGLIDQLARDDIQIRVKALPYGDYVINDSITIERKTAKDFLISLVDTRLFRQLSNLKKYCRRPILLIEGDPYMTDLDFNSNAIRGSIISVQTIWHTPVIFSRSKEHTRDILIMIGSQYDKDMDVVPLRGGYRPRRLRSRQLYLLQGLPLIGPRLAKRLMGHFGSISRVMNASVEELQKVEGIGLTRAEGIRILLDSGWDGT